MGAFEFQGPFPFDGDGDGFDSIATGGTDCDDANPTVFPGATEIPDDDMDQDCDGADAMAPPPASPPANVSVQVILLGGWNTLVWSGEAGVDPAELALLIGPRVETIWAYGEGLQAWEVYRPGGLDILNSLAVLAQGEALFLRLTPGEPIVTDLPDALPMQSNTTVLAPAWNFVGYTGAMSSIAGLLPDGVGVAFRYDRTARAWGGFFPGEPDFVNAFRGVERLTALFVRNDTDETLTIEWEQTSANP